MLEIISLLHIYHIKVVYVLKKVIANQKIFAKTEFPQNQCCMLQNASFTG